VGYRQLAVFPDCAWKFGQRLGVIWFEKRLREEDPVSEPLCWKQLDLEALHIWNEQEV